MFEYIKGRVETKRVDYVAIDVNGVGYKAFISLNTYEKIKDEIVKLFIHIYVREDIFVLYGFYSEDERELFKILINASGIGPKIAMAVLSTYSVEELKGIISGEEIKLLTKIPGLGIKKAQKLVLDVKDKINTKLKTEEISIKNISIKEDVALALESLGYSDKDIYSLIEKEKFEEYLSVEDAIKAVLRKIRMK